MPDPLEHRITAADQELPRFDTERFVVAPLSPPQLRSLAEVLLRDERLADQLPWMTDKSADAASREAFLLELHAVAGTVKAWGIVERARAMLIGAVLARQTLEGLDLEVLCASSFWNQGVADEAGVPVAEWLEDHTLVEIGVAH
jgi:RimJ/RimL family protein N-acetyltransferase